MKMNRFRKLKQKHDKFVFSKYGDELFSIESPICFGILTFGIFLLVNCWGC